MSLYSCSSRVQRVTSLWEHVLGLIPFPLRGREEETIELDFKLYQSKNMLYLYHYKWDRYKCMQIERFGKTRNFGKIVPCCDFDSSYGFEQFCLVLFIIFPISFFLSTVLDTHSVNIGNTEGIFGRGFFLLWFWKG